jgi:hypothetical protein
MLRDYDGTLEEIIELCRYDRNPRQRILELACDYLGINTPLAQQHNDWNNDKRKVKA